jgi:ABC-2 type transport system ATP-binding protein
MHLSVTEVKKQYATVLAVDHLSFEVKSGEIFALLGPNGAGKSSTIRMLVGLTSADAGNILFANQQGEKYERLDSADWTSQALLDTQKS